MPRSVKQIPIHLIAGLARRFFVCCCLMSALLSIAESSYAQNSEADVDRPLTGQSVFDDLFLNSSGSVSQYEIPFPFNDFLTSIEQRLGVSINDDINKLKTVLIPLGRCINRNAASPDFFQSPRIVIAAGSEDIDSDNPNSVFLKDRLFVGYQKTADAMEVISYNDELGRFEFQVVSNYGEGTQPIVNYAQRANCVTCHQNEGPIFAQAPWDETNNNQGVFRLLADTLSNDHLEPPIFRGSESADIDASTNRANLFTLAQQFWQGVCGVNSEYKETRCRAALFELVLQYRLQETNRTLASSDLIQQYLLPESVSNIQSLWPDGISIASSDIPNLNPLVTGEKVHLRAAEELKTPRTLRINWRPGNLVRIVQGLGRFIALSDIKQLDNRLYQLSVSSNRNRATISGDCKIQRTDKIEKKAIQEYKTGDISIHCLLNNNGISKTLDLLGNFYIESGKISELSVFSRLVLDSQSSIQGFTHNGGYIIDEGDAWVIRLKLFDSNRNFRARLTGGDIIDEVEIRWPRHGNEDELFTQGESVQGRAGLTVYQSNRSLELGLTGMIRSSEEGMTDVFSSQAFRGEKLMAELFEQLDLIEEKLSDG